MAWYNSSWGKRKKLTITGSADGALTDYQVKIMLQDGLAANYTDAVNTPNDVSQVYAVVGDYLYWARNCNADTVNYHGDIYKTNLVTGETANIAADIYGFAAFHCVKVGNYIYIAGQMVQDTKVFPWMTETIWRIDTTNDSVTSEQFVNVGTGDREFAGVDTDETNLYAGDLIGKIWQIPIATWDDYTTWVVKWTDPNAYLVTSVGTWTNGKTYALLTNKLQRWRIVSSLTSDLITWADEVDYTAQTAGSNDMRPALTVCGSTLVALGYIVATSTFHLFVFNGTTWDDYDLGIAPGAEGTYSNGVWLSDESKLAVMIGLGTSKTHDVYTVNLDGTGLTLECDNLSGCAWANNPRVSALTSYNSTYYYHLLAAAAPAHINRISRGHSLGALNNDDFSDIRFTTANGATLLDHWRESYTSAVKAAFWVELPSIGASPATLDIYVYYQNAGASTASNGDNTFPFFDDFLGAAMDEGAGRWYHWFNNVTTTVSGGIAAFVGHASYNGWGCKTKFDTNYAYRGLVKIDAEAAGNDITILGADDRSDDGTAVGAGADTAAMRLVPGVQQYLNQREATPTTATRNFALTAYSIAEVQRNASTNVRYLIANMLDGTIATNVPTDTMGLVVWCNVAARTISWDWVLVRKFTANEPNPSLFGAQQVGGSNIILKLIAAGAI